MRVVGVLSATTRCCGRKVVGDEAKVRFIGEGRRLNFTSRARLETVNGSMLSIRQPLPTVNDTCSSNGVI